VTQGRSCRSLPFLLFFGLRLVFLAPFLFSSFLAFLSTPFHSLHFLSMAITLEAVRSYLLSGTAETIQAIAYTSSPLQKRSMRLEKRYDQCGGGNYCPDGYYCIGVRTCKRKSNYAWTAVFGVLALLIIILWILKRRRSRAAMSSTTIATTVPGQQTYDPNQPQYYQPPQQYAPPQGDPNMAYQPQAAAYPPPGQGYAPPADPYGSPAPGAYGAPPPGTYGAPPPGAPYSTEKPFYPPPVEAPPTAYSPYPTPQTYPPADGASPSYSGASPSYSAAPPATAYSSAPYSPAPGQPQTSYGGAMPAPAAPYPVPK